ncbi:Hypothetical protein PBC10988_10030 [Planctomycetales bacterium 10988]|nr:Hypothetical protein PBC10988_10030 [Planctomycetales bacterium 10988]
MAAKAKLDAAQEEFNRKKNEAINEYRDSEKIASADRNEARAKATRDKQVAIAEKRYGKSVDTGEVDENGDPVTKFEPGLEGDLHQLQQQLAQKRAEKASDTKAANWEAQREAAQAPANARRVFLEAEYSHRSAAAEAAISEKIRYLGERASREAEYREEVVNASSASKNAQADALLSVAQRWNNSNQGHAAQLTFDLVQNHVEAQKSANDARNAREVAEINAQLTAQLNLLTAQESQEKARENAKYTRLLANKINSLERTLSSELAEIEFAEKAFKAQQELDKKLEEIVKNHAPRMLAAEQELKIALAEFAFQQIINPGDLASLYDLREAQKKNYTLRGEINADVAVETLEAQAEHEKVIGAISDDYSETILVATMAYERKYKSAYADLELSNNAADSAFDLAVASETKLLNDKLQDAKFTAAKALIDSQATREKANYSDYFTYQSNLLNDYSQTLTAWAGDQGGADWGTSQLEIGLAYVNYMSVVIAEMYGADGYYQSLSDASATKSKSGLDASKAYADGENQVINEVTQSSIKSNSSLEAQSIEASRKQSIASLQTSETLLHEIREAESKYNTEKIDETLPVATYLTRESYKKLVAQQHRNLMLPEQLLLSPETKSLWELQREYLEKEASEQMTLAETLAGKVMEREVAIADAEIQAATSNQSSLESYLTTLEANASGQGSSGNPSGELAELMGERQKATAQANLVYTQSSADTLKSAQLAIVDAASAFNVIVINQSAAWEVANVEYQVEQIENWHHTMQTPDSRYHLSIAEADLAWNTEMISVWTEEALAKNDADLALAKAQINASHQHTLTVARAKKSLEHASADADVAQMKSSLDAEAAQAESIAAAEAEANEARARASAEFDLELAEANKNRVMADAEDWITYVTSMTAPNKDYYLERIAEERGENYESEFDYYAERENAKTAREDAILANIEAEREEILTAIGGLAGKQADASNDLYAAKKDAQVASLSAQAAALRSYGEAQANAHETYTIAMAGSEKSLSQALFAAEMAWSTAISDASWATTQSELEANLTWTTLAAHAEIDFQIAVHQEIANDQYAALPETPTYRQMLLADFAQAQADWFVGLRSDYVSYQEALTQAENESTLANAQASREAEAAQVQPFRDYVTQQLNQQYDDTTGAAQAEKNLAIASTNLAADFMEGGTGSGSSLSFASAAREYGIKQLQTSYYYELSYQASYEHVISGAGQTERSYWEGLFEAWRDFKNAKADAQIQEAESKNESVRSFLAGQAAAEATYERVLANLEYASISSLISVEYAFAEAIRTSTGTYQNAVSDAQQAYTVAIANANANWTTAVAWETAEQWAQIAVDNPSAYTLYRQSKANAEAAWTAGAAQAIASQQIADAAAVRDYATEANLEEQSLWQALNENQKDQAEAENTFQKTVSLAQIDKNEGFANTWADEYQAYSDQTIQNHFGLIKERNDYYLAVSLVSLDFDETQQTYHNAVNAIPYPTADSTGPSPYSTLYANVFQAWREMQNSAADPNSTDPTAIQTLLNSNHAIELATLEAYESYLEAIKAEQANLDRSLVASEAALTTLLSQSYAAALADEVADGAEGEGNPWMERDAALAQAAATRETSVASAWEDFQTDLITADENWFNAVLAAEIAKATAQENADYTYLSNALPLQQDLDYVDSLFASGDSPEELFFGQYIFDELYDQSDELREGIPAVNPYRPSVGLTDAAFGDFISGVGGGSFFGLLSIQSYDAAGEADAWQEVNNFAGGFVDAWDPSGGGFREFVGWNTVDENSLSYYAGFGAGVVSQILLGNLAGAGRLGVLGARLIFAHEAISIGYGVYETASDISAAISGEEEFTFESGFRAVLNLAPAAVFVRSAIKNGNICKFFGFIVGKSCFVVGTEVLTYHDPMHTANDIPLELPPEESHRVLSTSPNILLCLAAGGGVSLLILKHANQKLKTRRKPSQVIFG